MTQLSFFGAAASEPALDDLAGLLAGPGQAVVRGDRARVSVVVAEEWRTAALRDALDVLGLAPEVAPTGLGSTAVRTPFTSALLPLATAWHPGGRKRPPAGLVLDGPRLRWWCLAAGRADEAGYLLRLGGDADGDAAPGSPVPRALAAAGLPALAVGARAGGPGLRVSGRRRLSRLRELVGEPPAGVPADGWPG